MDGKGRVRTVIATANREVYKDLVKAREAGALGETEVLPFVNRAKDKTHPDKILGDYVKSQGGEEGVMAATFSSVPRTCENCQKAIKEAVPNAKLETPAK